MPTFSIVIPTYNRAHFIERSVNSVIAQTYTDWELLIIDDGSTDNTKDVVEKYLDDHRISYIFQKNAKESAARNHGMRKANGNFLCLLDSDDEYHPNHLAVLYEKISAENFHEGFYHTYSLIKPLNAPIYEREITDPSPKNGPIGIVNNKVLVNNVCLSKGIYKTMFFREDLYINEDQEYFLRVATEFKVYPIAKHTTTVYLHNQNTAANYHGLAYYTNRIECLETLNANIKLMQALPRNYFKNQIARNYRWLSQALLRDGKKQEARRSLLKAIALKPSEVFQKDNIITALKAI
jgi:glycosyltransferase involved in cell wall biosynthesis